MAWDLRGDDAACDIARVNHMFEYNTTDVGGGTVGLYANNTSFVQADGNAWASSATPNQHVAYAAGSFVDASQVCWFISGCSL